MDEPGRVVVTAVAVGRHQLLVAVRLIRVAVPLQHWKTETDNGGIFEPGRLIPNQRHFTEIAGSSILLVSSPVGTAHVRQTLQPVGNEL
ncbi:hypothetical protein AB0D83_18835 [Streptomyces decoyicus]|uniref:hypothetical protein n=1 Tax=Streptomyces decoyicus TaxID=249567 RepID=UPI0033DFE7A2